MGAAIVMLFESVLILVALFSLIPLVLGFSPWWYRAWLGLMLLAMVWVAARRVRRTQEALEEQRRKRDERTGGRPPGVN